MSDRLTGRVEIILVETYLLLGVQQIKVNWLQGLLKVTVLGLAIVNIGLFDKCNQITRDVSKLRILYWRENYYL